MHGNPFPKDRYPCIDYQICYEVLVSEKKSTRKVEKTSFPRIPKEVLAQMRNCDLEKHFVAWIELCKEEDSCAICKTKGQTDTTLLCYHTFCHDCISKWSDMNTTCPVCRYEYEDSYIIQKNGRKKIMTVEPIERKMPPTFIPDEEDEEDEDDIHMH